MNKPTKVFAFFIFAYFATLFLYIGSNAQATYTVVTTKNQAHEIAEQAREMGLPEENPIIVEAKRLWTEADAQFQKDRDIIAVLVYNEAGYGCTIEHMETAAMVPVNRVGSPNWPDTIYDVVCQPGQYLPAYATPGSKYWKKATEDTERFKLCQDIAARALRGEIVCPPDVVYQANFTQAPYKGVVSIYSKYWACGNWTYFCEE